MDDPESFKWYIFQNYYFEYNFCGKFKIVFEILEDTCLQNYSTININNFKF